MSKKNHHYMVQINNFQDYPYTLDRTTHIANYSIVTPEQMNYIQSIDPASIGHLLDNNHDDALQYVKSLLGTPRSDLSVETYWLATLQKPGNPNNYTPIQKRILTKFYA